jgi:hypothetical protein
MTHTNQPGRSVIARLNDHTSKDVQFEAALEAINALLSAVQRLEGEIVELRDAIIPTKGRSIMDRTRTSGEAP